MIKQGTSLVYFQVTTYHLQQTEFCNLTNNVWECKKEHGMMMMYNVLNDQCRPESNVM